MKPRSIALGKSLILSIFTLLISFAQDAISNDVSFDVGQLTINGDTYSIEIAKTSTQRQHGLMFRRQLDMRKGMLFVFPQAGDHRIWMKNTLIPLSVIWLDDKQVVIDVQILPPCKSDPCEVYGVSKPSKYIIELNSQVRGIKAGDRIEGVTRLE